MQNGIPTVQIDNKRLRVTEWRLPPNTHTGHHRHEFDYVVVPMTDGVLTIADNDGAEKEFPLTGGQSYFRNAGVEHNVMNKSEREIIFIEMEVK